MSTDLQPPPTPRKEDQSKSRYFFKNVLGKLTQNKIFLTLLLDKYTITPAVVDDKEFQFVALNQ